MLNFLNKLAFAITLSVLLLFFVACNSNFGVKSSRIYNDAHVGGSIVSFSRQSTYLASGGWAGYVNTWHLESGKLSRRWQAHTDSVNGIVFIANDKKVVTAGYDGFINVWSIDGKLLQKIKARSPISVMILNRKANKIFTGHKDGNILIWELDTLKLSKQYAVHKKEVRALAYSYKRNLIASSGKEGRVGLIKSNGKFKYMQSPPSDSRTLQFSANSKELIGGGWFKLFSWDIKTGKLEIHSTQHKGIIKSIQLSADKNMLATISRQTDSSIYILDPATKKTKLRLASHELCGTFIAISPNNRFVATTSDDASVRYWDLEKIKAENSTIKKQ